MRTFTGVLVITFILLLSCNSKTSEKSDSIHAEAEISRYYLIRHAEKDRSDPSNRDPELTPEGQARAQRWMQYFDSISLDAVYSTNYNRTRSTATPTAESKGLTIIPYEIKDVFSKEFKAKTRGRNVLVVGHSNTTTPLANYLLGSERFPDMDDNDNSSLFVVTFKDSIPDVVVRTVD